MGLDVTGIGSVADAVSTVVNKIWPDKTEQEKEQMALAISIVQGQLATNQTEAGNRTLFVSGWRPFIGWVCGLGCAWNWAGLPISLFVAATFFHTKVDLHPADLSEMMPLLLGMLGLGGLRTYEKLNNVAAK